MKCQNPMILFEGASALIKVHHPSLHNTKLDKRAIPVQLTVNICFMVHSERFPSLPTMPVHSENAHYKVQGQSQRQTTCYKHVARFSAIIKNMHIHNLTSKQVECHCSELTMSPTLQIPPTITYITQQSQSIHSFAFPGLHPINSLITHHSMPIQTPHHPLLYEKAHHKTPCPSPQPANV